MIPAVTRSLFLPTLSTRKSEHQWGHRQGQEVGRAERAESEERTARPTSCPQDTRPTPLAWSQALPPNHARSQAGLIRGASALRLVYRPEPVRKPQAWR